MEADELTGSKNAETIVDGDLVSFFDRLAQYDYEDKQKEKTQLKTDPPASAPGGQF